MTIFDGFSPEARRINERALARARARMIEPVRGGNVISLQLLDHIDDSMVAQVTRALAAKPGAGEISAVIRSHGGFVDVAESIYSAMRRHGASISARAVFQCASAATTLLLAGDYREAAADTQFLLHQVSLDPASESRWTASRHQDAAAQLRATTKRLADFYGSRTGRAASVFQAEMANETPITAQRAFELGLVHRILT